MRKFGIGDKVFAKVRGYPAWPAKILAIADETPNKLRYHVFFYGTLETAVCKTEDLFPYAENKENYGRPSKRKFFNEGIAQIEGRVPVPDPRGADSSKQDEGDSDAEGKLIIDENPSEKFVKTSKRKRDSTAEDTQEKKVVGVSASDSAKRRRGSLPAQKRLKKDSTSSGGASSDTKNDTPSIAKQEIVSRSGRKIKPKRFADEAVNQISLALTDTETSPSQLQKNESQKLTPPQSDAEQGNKDDNVIEKKSEKIVLKDEFDPLLVRIKERRKLQLERWKKEAQMLKLISHLKTDLGLRKANPMRGLKVLEDLHSLGIDSLMLKKHPHVIETVAKLMKYVGNPTGWKYTKEQTRLFYGISEKIKAKAKIVMDEFKSMFDIPDGSTFKDVFSECVAEFQEKTRELDREKVYALIEDPTVYC